MSLDSDLSWLFLFWDSARHSCCWILQMEMAHIFKHNPICINLPQHILYIEIVEVAYISLRIRIWVRSKETHSAHTSTFRDTMKHVINCRYPFFKFYIFWSYWYNLPMDQNVGTWASKALRLLCLHSLVNNGIKAALSRWCANFRNAQWEIHDFCLGNL